MEQKRPNIVLPIIAGFVGLAGIVGAVTYYGSQQIKPQFKISLSNAAAVAVGDQNEPRPFSQEAYDQVVGEGKTVFLYFTSPWCPECDYAEMRLAQAAADWPSDRVAAFVVDFTSPAASSTSPEIALAETFNVTAPDTKVILRAGEVITQSTEVWGLERYREEIKNISL